MKTVLIVEDDPSIQTLLHDALGEQITCNVTIAGDGEEALEHVIQNPPDLIILDMMLPRIGGNALYYELKKINDAKDIPVIFMSGMFVDKEIQDEIKEMGALAYFVKPIDLKEMINCVKSVLK